MYSDIYQDEHASTINLQNVVTQTFMITNTNKYCEN